MRDRLVASKWVGLIAGFATQGSMMDNIRGKVREFVDEGLP